MNILMNICLGDEGFLDVHGQGNDEFLLYITIVALLKWSLYFFSINWENHVSTPSRAYSNDIRLDGTSLRRWRLVKTTRRRSWGCLRE